MLIQTLILQIKLQPPKRHYNKSLNAKPKHKKQLNTQAKAIDIKSVNDSTYTQSKSSPKGLLDEQLPHIEHQRGLTSQALI
ncbi:hypothetical protein BSPWISOXPB_11035 [uncultured Gammaproteobacteria bacterium]|nr:hypothetical protein BSPWISOXPB_11035 [uncultured Gammaproteobacteria bacterium]